MRQFIRTATLAAALLAALPAAQAATQSYTFNGVLDSGAYIGQSYSGSFSFDDASLTGVADEWVSVDSFSMNFMGNSYSLADAVASTEAAYVDGSFLGLSYSVDASEPMFSLIPGYFSASEAFLAYTPSLGLAGAGSLAFTAAVPEPESYAMLLAGLGLVGAIARRRTRRA